MVEFFQDLYKNIVGFDLIYLTLNGLKHIIKAGRRVKTEVIAKSIAIPVKTPK